MAVVGLVCASSSFGAYKETFPFPPGFSNSWAIGDIYGNAPIEAGDLDSKFHIGWAQNPIKSPGDTMLRVYADTAGDIMPPGAVFGAQTNPPTYSQGTYTTSSISGWVNLNGPANQNMTGLLLRADMQTLQAYVLNFNFVAGSIGLAVFNGTDYQDLEGEGFGNIPGGVTDAPVFLELTAVNDGSNHPVLTGALYQLNESSQLTYKTSIKFVVGVDTPQDEGEVLVLQGGKTGFYARVNTNQGVGIKAIDAAFDDISATGLMGDADYSGAVNVGDLGILATNYGGTNKTWAQGDFNLDGVVNVSDLGILATNYGQSGRSVPEPATLSLLAVSGLALLRRKQ